jgi:hypothetical protein
MKLWQHLTIMALGLSGVFIIAAVIGFAIAGQ